MMHARVGSGSLVVINIGELATNEQSLGSGLLGLRTTAAMVIEGGVIAWIGDTASVPEGTTGPRLDARGRCVLPGFVDSHTHLVFDGDRSDEFAARMAGKPYSAGGIATTVEVTRAADLLRLRENTRRLLREAQRSGTTTIEIKSGYGLSVEAEERCLRVARGETSESTFLGAHVVPAEFAADRSSYIDLVCGEMLDACAPHAKWVDCFCDEGAFDATEARAVLRAGIDRGLRARVHANQLGHGRGVQLAVELDAASADHCTHLDDDDVEALAASETVATLLPAAEFCTRSSYPDARSLLDRGVKVALGSDCNPGSSFTSSMPFVIALAVREMHMSVDEAILAASAGGARALRRVDVGSLRVGSSADFFVLDAPSRLFLAYRPGVSLISSVYQAGIQIC